MTSEDKAWLEFQEYIPESYDHYNYSSPLQSSVLHTSHKLVERAFDERIHFGNVLEVGAGTGKHLQFVRHTFDMYTLTDINPRMLDVAQQVLLRNSPNTLRFEIQTGTSLTYPDNTFDRLIAIHVLEHIYQPHLALREWRRVIKHGGVLSILIPTDPGIAWRLGRHLGPRRNAIARGISYDYIIAREHVNSCNNLVALLQHYYPEAKETWWPFPIASIDLNLFYAFHATVAK